MVLCVNTFMEIPDCDFGILVIIEYDQNGIFFCRVLGPQELGDDIKMHISHREEYGKRRNIYNHIGRH